MNQQMLQSLNPEQKEAVTTPEQHTLVLAGAGSGKTRVLTTRMAWLIQTQQISPYGIMAVTFTNKAAREMLTRLSAMLPINTRGLWVGTFHGLCNRMLRLHYQEAGLAATFQILDMSDQLSAIKRLVKAININTDKYPAKELQQFINNAKEKGLRPQDIAPSHPLDQKRIEFYQLYQDQCQREGVVDFGELLLRCYELLRNNELLRHHYQKRFQHILVDEFQDTNDLQYRWLALLAGHSNHLFAVGDDDQSIYSFRGALVTNMNRFNEDFAHGHIIRLEQNYRSYAHILHAANGLIENNSDRLGKNLWTDLGEGEPIRVVEMVDEGQEAQWITQEIENLLNDGYANREIAILYRSNAQSRPLEHALFSSGLRYKVYGGQRFFERQEIKHVLAYLRLAANLDDDTSFLRVVNFPARGIGVRTLEMLSDHAKQIGCSLAQAVGAVSGKPGEKLQQFICLIGQMHQLAQTLTLPELIHEVLSLSGLQLHYQTERDGQERLDNLSELVNAAQVFCQEENYAGLLALQTPTTSSASDTTLTPIGQEHSVIDTMPPLLGFLTHASLEAGDNQAQDSEQAIQLMTVHAAKGLEFKVVFVTGLEEGLFPHENSSFSEDGLNEERRLMYVAITRAQERLYLTMTQMRMLHGQSRYSLPSQFIDELPEETLKWLTPKRNIKANVGWGQASLEQGWTRQRDAFGRPSTGVIEPRAPRQTTQSVQVGEQIFAIGQTVRHGKFGEGTILSLTGQGKDAQAQIQFAEVGLKTLALGYAKLTIA